MTPEEEVLGRMVQMLDQLSIPYMVTGSIATSYHGRPRATHDADVVIDPSADQLEALLENLDGAGFYVSDEGARRAFADRRAFNAIETTMAVKVDLIVRKARPFSVEELRRRVRADLPFRDAVALVAPEDAILSKLEWARLSGDSARQLRDAAGVLELNPGVDRRYIDYWAEQLGVADLWTALVRNLQG